MHDCWELSRARDPEIIHCDYAVQPRLHELKHHFNVAVGWNRFRPFGNSQKILDRMWIEREKTYSHCQFLKGENTSGSGCTSTCQ